MEELERHIAYWSPLMTFAYGVMGWPRPEVAVPRWIQHGRPTDDPRLAVLDRWWGEDALGVALWAQQSDYPNEYSNHVARATNSKIGPAVLVDVVRPVEDWRIASGGDALHLGHFLDQLLGGPELLARQIERAKLIHDPTAGAGPHASLVLQSYGGWYATLAHHGAQLPNRPDGRSWQIHVTVAPLGYLGSFRRSRVTGRWFSGRHRWHMLGWTE